MEPSSHFIADDSSSVASPEWSQLEVITRHTLFTLYRVQQYGRWFVLKTTSSSSRRVQLQKEFDIAVQLDHPHIVRTLDFGFDPRVGDYIRMEWVDGMTLSEWLELFPTRVQRERVYLQLLDAVAYLHAHQIVHRDLKPSNILITCNGQNVKLIDFGVSDTDDYAILKLPAGSPTFIAPEQLAGSTSDSRVDIYSLGRIYQLLFPRSLFPIARRCLRTDPGERYDSVSSLHNAFHRAMRFRAVGWQWIVACVFMVSSIYLFLGWHPLSPFYVNPRDSITCLARELVQQQYDLILAPSHPQTIQEWSDRMNYYLSRCAEVRDSVANDFSNESDRMDFVNNFSILSGQLSMEYKTTYDTLFDPVRIQNSANP